MTGQFCIWCRQGILMMCQLNTPFCSEGCKEACETFAVERGYCPVDFEPMPCTVCGAGL